jgi:4-hydroxy-tetrahydrodipicolinate reductase
MVNIIKVIVNGAKGKMGQETIKAVQKEADLMLVGQTDLGSDLAKTIKDTGADVVVDFTVPQTVMNNIKVILANGAHGVIGTTGTTEADLQAVKALADKHKVNCLIAPNFAIGAVLMMRFAAEAARHMAKAEIIELHHDRTVDKPSGTAARTAELIEAAAPDAGPVPIHSVRLPGLVAHQEVILGDVGQTLTIRHDSTDRHSFMPGVLLAVRRVGTLTESPLVGLEHLL